MTGAGAAWCQSTESFDCLLQAEHDKLTTTGIKHKTSSSRCTGACNSTCLFQKFINQSKIHCRSIHQNNTEQNLSSLLQSAEMD